MRLPGGWTVQTVHFCAPAGARSNIFNMIYFTAATQGLGSTAGRLKWVECLSRDADTARVERTDLGYEISALGGWQSTSYTPREALERPPHGHFKGLPDAVGILGPKGGCAGCWHGRSGLPHPGNS